MLLVRKALAKSPHKNGSGLDKNGSSGCSFSNLPWQYNKKKINNSNMRLVPGPKANELKTRVDQSSIVRESSPNTISSLWTYIRYDHDTITDSGYDLMWLQYDTRSFKFAACVLSFWRFLYDFRVNSLW